MPEQMILTPEEKATILAGVHTATGNTEALKSVFADIFENGHNINLAREAILVVVFIAGAPRVIEALFTLSELCSETGRPYPDFPEDTLPGGPARHRAKGEEMMQQVYGPRYGKFAEKMSSLDGEFWSWLQGDAYGKCLGRPALEPRLRELTIAGILSALQRPMQIITHVNGALNSGATLEEVEATMQLVAGTGYDIAGALDEWKKIREKRVGNA
ncbi:MAG: carboxymuconolactone decarboxylase family protein [Planctomycetota bacterium]|jgi:4-carboxymuconolactone decarboxylase